MTIFQLKLFSIVIIFCFGFLGGWAALKAEARERGKAFFALGSALAAGIFLGAGLLHMLPDSQRLIALALPDTDFPLAEIYAGGGFALVLFLERVAFKGVDGNLEGARQEGAHLIGPYLLLIVLSLHSIIAGAALGAEDTILGSGAILIAILSHKASAGFSLAIDFLRRNLSTARIKRALLLFSAMTPLGIIFGAGLTHFMDEGGGQLLEGVFDGLAAGTFLYVGIVELVGEGFSKRDFIWAKFTLLVVGLSIMAVIALWM